MTTIKPPSSRAPGGRPRSFDETATLDRAMHVFWEKGYEGTSMADLTAATGLNPPSLYRAFGNKEQLFWKVMAHYADGPAAYARDCLREPTAYDVVARRLRGAVELACAPEHPWGCLAIQAARTGGEECGRVRGELLKKHGASLRALRRRLERARKEGDLPAEADPAGLANLVATLLEGISMRAAGGATEKELSAMVERVMQAWPALVSAPS